MPDSPPPQALVYAAKEAASLHQATLEAVVDGVLVVDLEGNIVSYNQQFVRMFNIPDELIAKRRVESIHELTLKEVEDPEGFFERVREIRANARCRAFSIVRCKDGRVFERYSMPHLVDGEPVGRVWCFRNVTERMRIEQELVESERKYRKLVAAANDAIFLADAETGIVLDANPRAADMLGRPVEEITGRHFSELLPAAERQRGTERFRDCVRQETTYVRDLHFLARDGQEIPVEISSGLLEIDERLILQGIVRDVSETKRAEAELQRRITFERAVAGISSRFVSMTAADYADGLRQAIAEAGSLVGSEHAVIALSSHDPQHLERFFYWRSPEAPPWGLAPQERSLGHHPWSRRLLAADEPVRIARLADLPAEAEEEADYLRSIGIRSVLSLPIRLGPRFLGVIAAVHLSREREWRDDEVMFLRIIGESIALLWGRLQTDDLLQRAHSHLEQEVKARTAELTKANEQLYFENAERRRLESALRQSESRMRTILDNIPDTVWLKDSESRFIAVNEALARQFHCTPEEMVGLTDFDLSPPEHARLYVADDREVVRTGRRKQVEEPHQDADGNLRLIETIKTPLRDEKGTIVGTVGIARDITERKRAEQEIARLKQQIEFVLGATRTGLDIIDARHNLRYIDPAWQKRYGDYEGKKCHEFFMGRPHPCPNCVIPRAIATKTAIVSEQILEKEGGRPIQVTTIPFQDESGEWLVAEVNVDITERLAMEKALRAAHDDLERRVEERTAELVAANQALAAAERKSREFAAELSVTNVELIRANEKLRELDRMKSEFLANISHELRTPMATILGAVETLDVAEAGRLDEQQRKLVDIARRNAHRLGRLIDNLIDLSQLNAGKFSIFKAPLDLRGPVERVSESLQATAARRERRIVLHLPPAAVSVLGDNDRLEQVFTNLVDNALRFASSTVTVRCEARTAHAVVTVEDDGPGIASEHLPQLFRRFARLGDTSNKSNMGIGLSIARAIVEAHGGVIAGENRPAPEHGMRFTVTLPRATNGHGG